MPTARAPDFPRVLRVRCTLPTGIFDGVLKVDRLTITRRRRGRVDLRTERSDGIITNASSTNFSPALAHWSRNFERRGSVPFRTRPLNRFIGEAILARNEVLLVLHRVSLTPLG
jgi:hypothetical protein